ncbi:MAG: type II CAAX endopeptidase family protein [Candidatus Micrarchaeaceae archaeon]
MAKKIARNAAQKQTRREKISLALGFSIMFLFVMLALQIPIIMMYYAGVISLVSTTYWSSAALSFSFSISAILYLVFFKRQSIAVVLRSIGLDKKRITLKILGIGVVLFLAIFALEAVVTSIEAVTHVTISTNVSNVFSGAPLWFFVFAAVIAPINEEIMFRGLFVPRLGIVASAVLFAIPHYVYGSTYGIEVIAAFVFALLAGYIYKKTGSLYASTLAHMLVNIFAVISLLV